MSPNKFYITTPIYYVNDVPHIGHAYTTLNADVLARYWKSKLGEKNVFFLVGTDEHGQKVAESAQKSGLSPKEFADQVAPRFQEAWKTLNIDPSFFIRTTDPRHEKVASDLLQKVYENGYVYEGQYEGLYCVGCEKFLTESELVDGKCPFHPNKKPVFQKEKNYFLRLKDLSKLILKKIEKGEYQILPDIRKNEIVARLKAGVEDISISRAEVSWGIPLPWDKSQTIYVWVEALMNYYSATQFLEDKSEFWPADLHLVGKDILWFHAVIWQAILIAANLPLPKTIFAHGFFTINGQKISKSLGNVIAPKDFVDRYGVDGARYLLLTTVSFGNDGDIKQEDFDKKYNADLANGLGNLVARIEALCKKADTPFLVKPAARDRHIDNAMEGFRPDLALNKIWKHVAHTDEFISQTKPWAKSGEALFEILETAVAEVRLVAHYLEPFMPATAQKIQDRFGGDTIKTGEVLFPRI